MCTTPPAFARVGRARRGRPARGTHSPSTLALGTAPALAAAVLLGLAASRGQEDNLAKELPRIAAHEPAEAPATFRLHAGFGLKMAASEPLVRSPVAACYDADGRLYAVEMRGYPFPEAQPTGGVSRLEDADGDGSFDRRVEFTRGLSWPTRTVPYGRGVFLTCAPDILP